MKIGGIEGAKLRNELHNLDINDVNDREVYYDKLYYIIASGEGFSGKVYQDSRGKLTIGYGFNMDRGLASKNEWDQIFKGAISFDDAKNGNITITKEQARMLKRYGVEAREQELCNIYAPYWDKMRLNERAIITDLYYQLPALAGRNTRLASYIKAYYKTSDIAYMRLAMEEISLHSSYSKNPLDRIGLQNRNNIRAIIFDSRYSLLYSKPNEELIPVNKQLEVIPGKTIISKHVSRAFPESNKLGDYYIWRTCGDDKVRSGHQELEGRVFKHEDNMVHPGDDYGCRCYRQKLPIHAKVIGSQNKTYDLEEEQYEKKFLFVNINYSDF